MKDLRGEMFKGGVYWYIEQLETMERCTPEIPTNLPKKLSRINTPLRTEWAHDLQEFPDQRCMKFLIKA